MMHFHMPDLINGLFEFSGGAFILNHCRLAIRDKAVAGVSILSIVFFTFWGLWNLYYYPHLHQWLSFSGGIFIVTANTWWVMLLMYYRSRPGAQRNCSE